MKDRLFHGGDAPLVFCPEKPKAFDAVIEKFDSMGELPGGIENINDAASADKLAGVPDKVRPFVTGRYEPMEQGVPSRALSDRYRERPR
jgi:hypothetical protein